MNFFTFSETYFRSKPKTIQIPTRVQKPFQILKIYCRKSHACKRLRHYVIQNGSRFVFVFFGRIAEKICIEQQNKLKLVDENLEFLSKKKKETKTTKRGKLVQLKQL
jgi:hypothetical protein